MARRKRQIGTLESVARELGVWDQISHLTEVRLMGGLPVREMGRRREKGALAYTAADGVPEAIELNRHLTDPQQRAQTFLHEVAHALDVLDRGTTDHGPQWKAQARRVGYDLSTWGSLSVSMAAERERTLRVIKRCTKCGAEQLGHRSSPHKRSSAVHTHAQCGGIIEYL